MAQEPPPGIVASRLRVPVAPSTITWMPDAASSARSRASHGTPKRARIPKAPGVAIRRAGAHRVWWGMTIWHGSMRQLASQPSPLVVLPSSHCSFGSTEPSPQICSSTHVLEQPSPLTVLPSSQASPTSTTWLPHCSNRHAGEQPSPPTVLPSSHCSIPSVVPLPHVLSSRHL